MRMNMGPTEDYEYGESRVKDSLKYEWLHNKRYAINGMGGLPAGFDHVKLHHKAPKNMSQRERFYFYTHKKRSINDTTYVDFSPVKY